MSNKFLATGPLLAVILLLAATLPAGATPNNYWDFNAGAENNETLAGPDQERLEFNRGGHFSVARGGQVGALQTEYRLAYGRATVEDYADSTGSTAPAGGELRQLTLRLNFYERRQLPPTDWNYRIFWLLGFGVSRVELAGVNSSGTRLYEGTDYPLTYGGGLGLEFSLTANTALTFKYSLSTTEKLDFTRETTGEAVSFDNLDSRRASLGFRWLY